MDHTPEHQPVNSKMTNTSPDIQQVNQPAIEANSQVMSGSHVQPTADTRQRYDNISPPAAWPLIRCYGTLNGDPMPPATTDIPPRSDIPIS
jgi:hypothetical protein